MRLRVDSNATRKEGFKEEGFKEEGDRKKEGGAKSIASILKTQVDTIDWSKLQNGAQAETDKVKSAFSNYSSWAEQKLDI